MERCSFDDNENAPIHTLPYEVMRDLSRILDAGDTWVELATKMPDITMQDVDGCRQFCLTHRGSPSEYLLRIWASKGYSILSLYNLFAITRMVRCMRTMHHLIPESYHCLERYNLSSDDTCLPSSCQSNQQLLKGQHTSITSLRRGDAQQQRSPVGASSSIQKSSGVSSTSESTSAANMSDPIWSALQNTLTVPYSDLQAATSNFSDKNVLGKGGYGVVYVGEWKHTKIAVKRFMSSGSRGAQIQRERLRQSLQELKTLAKFRHDNILPLYAFSLEGPEPCLVYQFMFNGSLEDRLLCRIEADAEEKSPLIASHVKGTLAYLPPEFISNRILSTKLDVYSFGIVLLEICTGMRAFMDSRVPPNLADYCIISRDAQNSASERSSLAWVETLMDKRTPCLKKQGSFISNSAYSLMPKRAWNHNAPSPAKDRLCSQTFLCSSSAMVVMLFYPGDRYCFYGTARIQCLAGDFFVDEFKMPPSGNVDFDSMRHVSAPYRLSRPAVLRSINSNESPTKYKLNRLKYRLKEITPHYEQVMMKIGERYPGVVIVDRKPPQTIRVLDQVLQDFFVPSWLWSSCQFDRTLFFNGEFEPYHEKGQAQLSQAMGEVNKRRAEGIRCVVVPVGGVGSGKSTLVRYIVNTNLRSEGPPIYILDTDVGQSEFTPPGCMSLWKISDPILDVPCTHQAQVYPCCYFFGNVTPADDAERYKDWDANFSVIFSMSPDHFLQSLSVRIVGLSIFPAGCQLLSRFCPSTPLTTIIWKSQKTCFFMRITVCIPEDYSYVDDRYFLAAMNVQIVALCSHSEDAPLNTRRLLGNESLPLISIVRRGSPILLCHGYGIVRAIDLEKRLFYLITPAPLSELSKVTVFARGTDILVPQILLESQPAGNVLYLSRPVLAPTSGIITDLYSGLKNIKTGRREYFPQTS
ncbi:hypothetical protein GCK32_000707 [Trichostrongylus colubriformis]|uniref:Protein kinase domain-containing protein n=1 Tax=Trichostrongylus colubriformis TaxID=6319 RepID=A0AAN8FKB0_TRICO